MLSSYGSYYAVRNPRWPTKNEPWLMYDVVGDHPREGSTVSVKTLVDNEIPILDLSEEEIRKEYAKMVRFLSATAS